MAFLNNEDESWLEFLSLPGGLFSEVPKLEDFDNEGLAAPVESWECSSWEVPADPLSCCLSSTEDAADYDAAPCLPVLLPASEFVFQRGDKTETLAQRVAPPLRPVDAVVTTGHAHSPSTDAQPASLDYAAIMKLLESDKTDPPQVQSERENPRQKGKRKLPEVDLESIADPEERKRQKRMAKNRRTAAVSRLRKKARLENLEHDIVHLRQENQKLKEVLSQLLLVSKERTIEIAPQIDELAMLMTVVILVIMQSAAVRALNVLMTPPPLTPPLDLVKLAVTMTARSSSSMKHLSRMTEHFSCYGAGRWQQNGIT